MAQHRRSGPALRGLLAALVAGVFVGAAPAGHPERAAVAAVQEPAGTGRPALRLPEGPGDNPPVPCGPEAPAARDWPKEGDRVAKDLGRVVRVSEHKDHVPIVIFEETHTSRAGQIEIAWMLLRLYRDYRTRHIALEGYVRGSTADAKWFHLRRGPESQKRLVAAQFLEDGEVNSAEFLALVFPDVVLHPIEDGPDYNVELGDRAGAAGYIYLFRIAAKRLNPAGLTPEQVKKLKELQDAKEIGKLIDYVINLDPWASEKAKMFRDLEKVVQIEAWLETLDAIEKEIEKVGADVQAEERKLMGELKAFFEARGRASRTMVAATTKVAPKRAEGPPTAMVIGAAHTDEVCRLLRERGRAYLVIRPQSFGAGDKSSISAAAFRRKGKQLSVDDAGLPGALLDGRPKEAPKTPGDRKKPQPVLSQEWFRAKADLSVVAGMILAAAGGKAPRAATPFGLDTEKVDRDFPMVRVEWPTLERDPDGGDEVVFKVILFPLDDRHKQALWVRGLQIAPDADTPSTDVSTIASLEELLKTSLGRVKAGRPTAEAADRDLKRSKPTRRINRPAPKQPPLIRVSTDALIKAAPDKEAIQDKISGDL